ncbi:diaminopimelate epimerase [Nocardioides sp.]|uniref:diaminopimelate epimerase n=1 Tax=Nocardioides sp. TaxID=35761 RepID=UPI002716F956|nr:diaminopimelate epimerase [Nocardioides sp.]MDO9457276.1 diaminopimelate epimerase [Nocardioides sp.]
MSYPFLKGHGTHNDFVLLPDLDGSVHGDLDVDRVRALCDRRGGIGGDGVLRVLCVPGDSPDSAGRWFMDYRNADGSVAEMCGNGIRVFALHLVQEGLAEAGLPFEVDTRDGVKTVTVTGDEVTVDMGVPQVLGETQVSVGDRTWAATHVDVGNPHAVAFVDELDDAGPLLVAPTHDTSVYPSGVNVEFVVRRGDAHVAMRVHERGSGETQACGTGACAVAVAAMPGDGAMTCRVDQPGGTVTISRTPEGRVLMTGPAVVVARGTTDL